MSRRIAKNRKHITIAFLTMALSSMSVFLAMPNSTANPAPQNVLRITKIEPQLITVGEHVLVKGEISNPSNPTKIKVVKINSPNCGQGQGEVEARLNPLSNKWSANYRFSDLKDCQIQAIGQDNTDPLNVTTIDTSSFYVEVQEAGLIEQVREISDEISSGKNLFFVIGLIEAAVILIALWLIFGNYPNIQKTLTAIDENVNDIRLSSRYLPPHIEDIVPNEAKLGDSTTVTIRGRNLDDKPEVLLRGISGDIRDIKCKLTSHEYDEIVIQLPWELLIRQLQLLIGQKLPQNFHLIVRTAGGSAMRPFKLLKPTLNANKPKSIPTAGGWNKLTGAGFTVGTKVFDVDKNKYLDKAYIDSSTLIVQWPPEAAKTQKNVEIRGEFGQSKQLTVEYST